MSIRRLTAVTVVLIASCLVAAWFVGGNIGRSITDATDAHCVVLDEVVICG